MGNMNGLAMKRALFYRLILGCATTIALSVIGTPAIAQGLLDGLTDTVQQKLKEATQGVLNQNTPPAEQKPEGNAEDTPSKNTAPAEQKSGASPRGALDKYTRPSEQTPEPTISKEELFEAWMQEYLDEGKPSRANSERPPFLNGNTNQARKDLATVLYNDYGMRCAKSPEDGAYLAWTASFYDVLNDIIKIQHGNDSHRLTLEGRVSSLTTGTYRYCPEYANQIRQFLDDFAIASEEWHQQNVEYHQRKREEEAKLAQLKADKEAAARQAKTDRERVEKEREVAARQAKAERTEALRSGQAKVESYGDARLFYQPMEGFQLVMRPKVQPDGKVYEVQGILERVEGSTLLVKFADKHYFFITAKEKQPRDFMKNLRIGGILHVIGRYTSNREYTTVIGATRTAVVFEAISIVN
jgi:hypothetical protein